MEGGGQCSHLARKASRLRRCLQQCLVKLLGHQRLRDLVLRMEHRPSRGRIVVMAGLSRRSLVLPQRVLWASPSVSRKLCRQWCFPGAGWVRRRPFPLLRARVLWCERPARRCRRVFPTRSSRRASNGCTGANQAREIEVLLRRCCLSSRRSLSMPASPVSGLLAQRASSSMHVWPSDPYMRCVSQFAGLSGVWALTPTTSVAARIQRL